MTTVRHSNASAPMTASRSAGFRKRECGTVSDHVGPRFKSDSMAVAWEVHFDQGCASITLTHPTFRGRIRTGTDIEAPVCVSVNGHRAVTRGNTTRAGSLHRELITIYTQQ